VLDDLTVKERRPGETIENAESLDLKLLKPHRQLAKTLPGSMENRVADCGVGPDIAQLADTLFFPTPTDRRKITARSKTPPIRDDRCDRGGPDNPDTEDGLEPLTCLVRAMLRNDPFLSDPIIVCTA
jgi:hypothetical protein